MISKKFLVLPAFAALILSFALIPVDAQETELIPSWVKATAGWWSEGNINDDEFMEALEFLIENGAIDINVDESNQDMSPDPFGRADNPQAVAIEEGLRAEVKTHEDTIGDLESQLEQFGDEDTRTWYKTEIEDLRQKWQDEYREKSDLQESYDLVLSQKQSLQNHIDQLNEQLEKYPDAESLETHNQEMNQLKQTLHTALDEKREIEDQNKQLVAQNKSYVDHVSNLQEQINDLQEQLEE